MLTWPAKDPDEVLDYEIDWTARLAGDTINTSSWIMPSGITQDSVTVSPTKVKIWLSDGTEGEQYIIQNRIVTNGGRTMDQSVKIKIKTK